MHEKAVLHEAIRDAADPMTLLDRIVLQSLILVPKADGASLEMRRDADALEYISAAGTLQSFVGLRLPLRQSLSGLAVLTGDVQLCADGLDDARVNREAVQRTGVRSMLCVPLSADEQGVAVLKVSSREPHAFTDADADRLRILARFLEVTVSAASRLARVTAEVLTELDTTEFDASGREDRVDAARFVANIMTPGLVDRVHAATAIRDVIDDDTFEIVLQPIVDLSSGEIVSCEALSRIHGPLSRTPDWWFAAAHSVGLGIELEEAALRKALRALAVLPPSVQISVNVGCDLLLTPGFADLFEGMPLDRLTLELTEHDEVRDYAAVIGAMHGLRSRGARLSVDDTGSGYSGLTHILRLRPDVIKLDRELVTDIHVDPAKKALAAALVLFAQGIGALVVAEGIEQQAEADCLRELGADYGQGYLFARAMSPEDLVRMIQG